MPSSLHTQRRHTLVLLVSSAVLLPVSPVAAEIVKCVAKDGSPLYQNFPCHIDSLGSLPSNASVARPASTPAVPAREKSKSESIAPASSAKSTDASEPRIGMTAEEVTALLGEPEERVEDEPPSGRVTVWRYADGRLVHFNNKRRVLVVQR